MSRLIDADKVDIPIMQRQNNGWVFKCNFKEVLDTLPTVEAIPIEWIMWKWRRNQPCDTQEDAWMRLGVLKMLRDWEKENEID